MRDLHRPRHNSPFCGSQQDLKQVERRVAQQGSDGRIPVGSTGLAAQGQVMLQVASDDASVHRSATAQELSIEVWKARPRAYLSPTRLLAGKDRVRGSRLTSRRSTSAPTSHATPTSPRRTRRRPPIAAEVRHMIVLAGVEPRHERAAPKSHIFQITRRAANYLKVDRLLGRRMELWGAR